MNCTKFAQAQGGSRAPRGQETTFQRNGFFSAVARDCAAAQPPALPVFRPKKASIASALFSIRPLRMAKRPPPSIPRGTT